MGPSARGICGDAVIKWPQLAKTNFDHKAFREDHPDMDLEPYYKTTQYRRFSVEIQKEEAV